MSGNWQHPPSDSAIVRFLVDRMHVGTSDADVEAVIRAKLAPGAPHADAIVRDAIAHHYHNREVYAHVMGG